MDNKVVEEREMVDGDPKEALSDVAGAVLELSEVTDSLTKITIYYGEAISEVIRKEEGGNTRS